MDRRCVTGSFVLDHNVFYLQHSRASCGTSFPMETTSIQIEPPVIYFFRITLEMCIYFLYCNLAGSFFFFFSTWLPRPTTGYLKIHRLLISSYLISKQGRLNTLPESCFNIHVLERWVSTLITCRCYVNMAWYGCDSVLSLV